MTAKYKMIVSEAVERLPDDLPTHHEDGYLYILLTDTKKPVSKLIKMKTGEAFNHVSLSFDKTLNTCWSFNIGQDGPVAEDKLEWPDNTSFSLYRVRVTQKEMDTLKREITQIFKNKEQYTFSIRKALFGFFLDMDIDHQNAYFCSEFVDHLLSSIGHPNDENRASKFISPYDVVALRKKVSFVKRGKIARYFKALPA